MANEKDLLSKGLQGLSLDDFMDSPCETPKTETDKDVFVRMVMSTRLSDKTKKTILDWLDKTDFYQAPASSKFHNNVEGGLCNHSINVAKKLDELTKTNSLKWDKSDSPIIIGLFHDLCKVNFYTVSYRNVKVMDENHKEVWTRVPFYQVDDKMPLYGIHGDRSVMYLMMMTNELTLQELACIRFHMGNTQEGETQAVNNAMKADNNIYWTNVADTLAALSEPVSK